MVPAAKDSSGHRKIGSLLSRASTSGLAPITIDGRESGEKRGTKKVAKRSSLFHIGATISSELAQDESLSPISLSERADSPSSWRPRTLQKGRPGSMFGSLGKKSVNPVREGSVDDSDTVPESPMESLHVLDQTNQGAGKTVLHHGEVQTTSGLFRKKREYLVLTDTHLIRYKSQIRASETFPSIPSAGSRSGTVRHASTASIGSMQDLQSLNSHASAEGDNAIALRHMVTAYKVEDGRPFFTTEVVYLDEETNSVGSIQLMLHDPKEADLWHTSIRGASLKAKLLLPQPYPDRLIRHLVHVLETDQDYDANHFHIFRVVRRAKSGGRSSSDDLAKLGSSIFYLVVGINMIHLVSLPDFGDPSMRMMDVKSHKSSYGLVTLLAVDVQYTDDAFQLGFRTPQQLPFVLELAASSSTEIASAIIREILYLKPQWLEPTFHYSGATEIDLENTGSSNQLEEEYGYFDRTLIAYCAGYRCNPGYIRYTIDHEAADAPEFRLLPPAASRNYTVLEILAVFRALRYNESFRSISFDGISLQCLHGLVDLHGEDHIAVTSRSGLPIRKYFGIEPSGRSLLYQEIQALALKSLRVRRMNFSNTLPKRRPRDNEDSILKDPGCEISAALLPLCRGQLTDVDWIIFRGIELGETDLEELGLALDEKKSHFRCVDVSHCALNDRGVQIILNHLEKQHATIECINISDNPGRLHLGRFPITMSRFSQIRRLDLSRVSSSSGTEPIIAPEVLLAWRLEELYLTGVPVNDKSLDAISTYLASEMSNSLYCLQMDQCNLTGAHVAILMRSMSRGAGIARKLHLHVSANRLEKGNGEIVKAIEENYTPSHVTMRMVEYQTESRFRQLLQALQKNTTIQSLDISKASLPYDAGEETCEALQILFEENTTLEELDISGEHAHLEVARFGIGLNRALNGLKKNKALKTLKIEYQNLGLEGANTLSSVLEDNDTLTHIYCEHNDISLSGFTVLVNALARNFTVLFIPLMMEDQTEAVKKLTSDLGESRAAATSKVEGGVVKSSVRRTLTTLGVQKKAPGTPQDVGSAVEFLNSNWQQQADRLAIFLERNQNIADGLETREMYFGDDTLRPMTALSEARIIDHALSNTTPRVELTNPVDEVVYHMGSLTVTDKKEKLKTNDDNEMEFGRSRSASQATASARTFELGGIDDSPSETDV